VTLKVRTEANIDGCKVLSGPVLEDCGGQSVSKVLFELRLSHQLGPKDRLLG
jgi:hypothetical protein